MVAFTLNHKKRYLFLSIFFALVFLYSCGSPESVKIGFIAGLTGRVADLGIAGRDGAILAVEQINREGGIAGRRVDLIIRDDKHNGEQCTEAVRDLIAEGVEAIVGPMTSSMAQIVVPLINNHKIVTIAPTVATDKLSFLDDYFFRIMPACTQAATRTAQYLYNEKLQRKIVVVYDLNNKAYTESWYHKFQTDFELLGGAVDAVSYFSEPGKDLLEVVRQISKRDMDCIVILANALDTAMICQQLLKKGSEIPLIASEWSLTESLLEFGGNAVEGLELFHSFNRNDESASYRQFSEEFHERFGYYTDFASAYAYNAVKVLVTAMKKSENRSDLKENILSNGPYEGVQDIIRFNRFGDVERDYTLLRINNKKIITL